MISRVFTAAAAALAVAILAAGPAAAGSHAFLLNNMSGSDVTGVSVKNGSVEGFKRVRAKGSGSFTIVVPDGTCRSRIRIRFANGGFTDNSSYDICSGDGLTVIGP